MLNYYFRKILQKEWFFNCKCERCMDQDELGTFMSSPKCSSCLSGYLLPMKNEDPDYDWKCNNKDCTDKSYAIDDILEIDDNIKQNVVIFN